MKKQPRVKNPVIFNFRKVIRELSDIKTTQSRKIKTEKTQKET